MIPQFYPRAIWEQRLRDAGCVPAEGIPKRATGEYWRYPEPGKYPMFVSVEPDGSVESWVLIRLLRHIKGVEE